MSDVDNLTAAVVSLSAGFVTLDIAVKAEIAALVAALGGSNPAVAAAASAITDLTSKMAADATAMTASLPVPPSP